MKASMLEEGRMLRRSLGSQYPVGSSTLSLGAIVGISIGGAVLLFVILVTIGVIHVNKKHRREKERSEANETGNATMDLQTAIRSTRPPETNMARRVSFNPFLHYPEDDNRQEWARQDGLQKPPRVKSRSPHRSIFRAPSVRDSWPLNTTVPLGFRPGQTPMVLNPVAPPGYVVQDPKWPKRTTSLPGRKSSQDSYQSAFSTRDPYSEEVIPYRKVHRRSTSETQLSTILRSTSQRLKAAQRHSMTRVSSTLGQSPGLPPSARLPTPPRKTTESREQLIDQLNAVSVGSSIYDVYSRTPSPKKKHQRTSSKRSIVKPRSPAASIESKDSLCLSDTTDLIILAPLTSPSKSPRVAQRQTASQASGAKDTSVVIHQDSQASLFARDAQEGVNNKTLSHPRRISSSDDPFYTSIRNSKPMMPSAQVQGPRPMYIRKATFGQIATVERPTSLCSPLRDVSGNAQQSPKRELPNPPATSEPNLFQWLPQEAMQARATQTSGKSSNPRRKGHKRSNVIRMSNLTRPASMVDVLPEEPETVAPLKFNVPGRSSFHSVENSQNASPTKSPKTSVRPPSIATFNPTLIAPALSGRSEDNSPALGSEDKNPYSPTLSVCNYYAENDPGSEDEFFKTMGSKSLRPSPSVIKSRRSGRSYSADLSAFPTSQSQQHSEQRLMSFPPLPADDLDPVSPTTSTPRPAPRPLPNITATMNGLRSSTAILAPPLLTVPGHLTGPRSEPEKQTGATLSPPGSNSIITSISLLRRMNSEVSTICSSPAEASSPTLPLDSPSTGTHDNDRDIDRTATVEERGRSRGSQHYLSFGQTSPSSRRRTRDKARSARPEIRDSHRIHKERRRRRTQDLENGNMIDELTPVKEGSSPPGAGDATGRSSGADTHLRFPTLNRERSSLVTPPRTKSRLSTVTLEPTANVPDSAIDHADFTSSVNSTGTVLRSIECPDDDIRLSSSQIGDQRSHVENASAQAQARPQPRWSDAMTKPATHATRRESKMEHPIPSPGAVTPPDWTTTATEIRLSGLGLAGVRLMERDEGRVVGGGGEEADGDKRDSMSLYDQDGFLKGSPERDRILAVRTAQEKKDPKRRKSIRGFAM